MPLCGLFRRMVTDRQAARKEESRIVKRARAVALVRSGKTRRAVAKELGASVRFVGNWLQRASERRRYTDAPRSGRPVKFTRATTRRAVVLSHTKTYGSVQRITQKLQAEKVDISKSTVRRMLRRTGRRYYKRAKKPKLTAAHRTMRLEWATRMINEPMEVINRMVFADEKRFAVGGEAVGVWRLPDEPRPIRETGKHRIMQTKHH